MFRIKSNDDEIYNLKSKDYLVETPKLTMELNKSGELSFYIPPTHPNYEKIKGLTSKIKLYNNNVLEFVGRAIENKDSFNKKRYVKIEGELSYLYDSIQRLNVYKCTPIQFFQKIIENHNNQVEEDKRFNVGMFTIQDANDYIYRYTNYEDTLTVINEKLIKQLGGFLRVRYANGNRYLDLLQDYGRTNSQVIKFGENILDLDKYIKFSSIRTAMIPLGNELDETVETEDETGTIKKRLTIEEFPDGKYGDIVKRGDMIYSESGVAKYGYIYADKEDSLFNNITLKENLFSKSVESLNKLLENSLTIELTAIDLNLINVDIEKIELGDKIRVLSSAHNLDEFFVVNKIVKDLANPKNNKIILGNSLKSMTSSINRAENNNTNMINELSGKTSNDLIDAKQKASDAIKSVQGGYVKLIDGELFILDNENINLARKIWRWNLNGLGYTQEGKDGIFGLAMTMDGQIVADYITTGTLRSIQIINGNNFSVDASGNMIANSGNIAGWDISSTRFSKTIEQELNYTQEDVNEAYSYLQEGTIFSLDAYNYLKYDANLDGNLDITDVVKMINIKNGVETQTILGTVKINADNIMDTILIESSQLGTKTSIGARGVSANRIAGNKIIANQLQLNGNMRMQIVTNNGYAKDITGYPMIGENLNNAYSVEWDGNFLNFNVDGVNVAKIKGPTIQSYPEPAQRIDAMWFESPNILRFSVPGVGWRYHLVVDGGDSTSSDRRLKKDIQNTEVKSAMDIINKINHYSFTFKENDVHKQIGYIAQELEKLDKDFVKITNYPGQKIKNQYFLNEKAMIPYITLGMQELYRRIEKLEKINKEVLNGSN